MNNSNRELSIKGLGGAMSHIESGLDVMMSQSPLSLFYAGNFAVCIFYVICGYGITVNFRHGGCIQKTLLCRFFKLFLPICVTNLIYYLFCKVNFFTSTKVAEITGSNWLEMICQFNPDFKEMLYDSYNVILTGMTRYNAVLWAIPYLFFGAFFVFIILSLSNNLKNKCIIYFVSSVLVSSIGKQGTITFNYYIAFLV